MNDQRETKIRKFICDGEAVRVSLLYQWATIFLISTYSYFYSLTHCRITIQQNLTVRTIC